MAGWTSGISFSTLELKKPFDQGRRLVWVHTLKVYHSRPGRLHRFGCGVQLEGGALVEGQSHCQSQALPPSPLQKTACWAHRLRDPFLNPTADHLPTLDIEPVWVSEHLPSDNRVSIIQFKEWRSDKRRTHQRNDWVKSHSSTHFADSSNKMKHKVDWIIIVL